MKIEKIKKMSKDIKEYYNNIDVLGIYYIFHQKHKPLEIHLTPCRFLHCFKNQVEKMYFECGEEKKKAGIKSIAYGNYINNYNIELCIKICGIKYFCLLNNKVDYYYAKYYLIHKTNLFKIKKEVI